MGKANNDIYVAAKSAGVKLWQIADALGMMDSNFSRKLRKELPADEKEKIRQIITNFKVEAENEQAG